MIRMFGASGVAVPQGGECHGGLEIATASVVERGVPAVGHFQAGVQSSSSTALPLSFLCFFKSVIKCNMHMQYVYVYR